MASNASGTATRNPPPQDKSWLLPFNRRLRHLQGITIRNISLVPDSKRGKTIDDEGLPSTLRSPSKALALREKKLEHVRSSTDLRSHHEPAIPENGDVRTATSPKSRPSVTRMRRRSTMEWSGASPVARQKKLEDVAEGRMADVFFSIHVEGKEEPVYVSEVATKVMNPNYRFFDLEPYGPEVTRLSEFTVKFWAKTDRSPNPLLLVDYAVTLQSLQFIGKSLESLRLPLPPNCIIFHLTDGIYTSFLDIPAPLPNAGRSASHASNPAESLPSSSYDALMRLSTLDDCIQDALNTREQLTLEIEGILEESKVPRTALTEVPEVELRLRSIESSLSTQKKRLEATRRQRKNLQSSLDARKSAIEQGRKLQREAKEDAGNIRKMKKDLEDESIKISEDIIGQRRRICDELSALYPIEPVQGKSLSFTIRGFALPNSDFNSDANEPEIAAALGYVAKVVHQLALYLSISLPYPIRPRESTSSIEDPISMMTGPRIYPLFIKGAVRYRFEYGVFLLNKNIEILSTRLGLRLLDIRQTLPNLKYLLFVATAGSGELPSRKAGGVRGLLKQMTAPLSADPSAPTTVVVDGKGVLDPGFKVKDANSVTKHMNGKPTGAQITNGPRIGTTLDVT